MRISFFYVFLYVCSWCTGQVQDKVDFLHAEVQIHPIPKEKAIHGSVVYQFKVLADVDSVFLDAQHMEFQQVRLDKKKTSFSNNGRAIVIKNKFKAGKTHRLELTYSCTPEQTVYFIGWDTGNSRIPDTERSRNGQIWTQGQGKYTSHWLPSFDDMNEKVEFDLKIIFDADYEVIANGKLVKSEAVGDRKSWDFDMQKPMSSYLLAFAIGKYGKQELVSKSGVPLITYFYPWDSLRVEPTYRYTQKIFDFLEEEIGVAYPWQNYKQVPVHDFLYAGMENTGTTIFSDGYMIDSVAFIDKNYVNVNAHEMAHQWFGNLVTEKDGHHHWLHEGFATYYAYLAEREIFGNDHFYWRYYDTAEELKNLSDSDRGEALTDPKAGSLTFYEKGAWALLALRDEIGNDPFKKGIKSYLQKFGFGNATVSDLIAEMEAASDHDLSGFTNEWLHGTVFPFEKAKSILAKNSKSVGEMFLLQEALANGLEDATTLIQGYWDPSPSPEFKSRVISKYHRSLSTEFIREALMTDDLKVRQAVAFLDEDYVIPLKDDFESLLQDDSYLTRESALYLLWANFPTDRARYLDTAKGLVGLPNKNLRLLWLVLALHTNGYEDHLTESYFEELSGYTHPSYPFEVRQGAFQWLDQAFGLTDQNLRDLIAASVHHAWQFRKFARDLLDTLLADEDYRERVAALADKLIPEEKRYIQSKLDGL